MSNILIVYKSKYGTTRQYAQWLAEDLGARLLEHKAVRTGDLEDCDTLILGGGLYAGGMLGASLLKKNYARLQGKRVALFTCGLGDPAVEDNLDNILAGLEKDLGPQILSETQRFHLRGGIDYSRLTFLHRTMMSMVRKALANKKPEDRTDEDLQMLETFGKTVSFVDRASLAPILAWARSEGQGRA